MYPEASTLANGGVSRRPLPCKRTVWPESAMPVRCPRSGDADFSGYIGRVQKALLRRLCGNAAARPGAYRLACGAMPYP